MMITAKLFWLLFPAVLSVEICQPITSTSIEWDSPIANAGGPSYLINEPAYFDISMGPRSSQFDDRSDEPFQRGMNTIIENLEQNGRQKTMKKSLWHSSHTLMEPLWREQLRSGLTSEPTPVPPQPQHDVEKMLKLKPQRRGVWYVQPTVSPPPVSWVFINRFILLNSMVGVTSLTTVSLMACKT